MLSCQSFQIFPSIQGYKWRQPLSLHWVGELAWSSWLNHLEGVCSLMFYVIFSVSVPVSCCCLQFTGMFHFFFLSLSLSFRPLSLLLPHFSTLPLLPSLILFNSVQTSALNLHSLCLTKHMECYCSGMLQVCVAFSDSACVCVINRAHVLKQMGASRTLMIMIMVRVCFCAPPRRTE